ncbi:hypothetical protein GGR53DRAFT_521589 [Hypoxylon sp. FL1150]|nr:hypothetical protein GGR53DRAFT_521589 [Hypoxylon sp. FL1150]
MYANLAYSKSRLPNEAHGEFWQWYPATFTVSETEKSDLVGHPIDEDDPEGWQPIYFHCAEQFMIEQKQLARLTKGFDAASWDEIKSPVVVAGNMAKFGQNPRLRSLLLDTGDRLLAEAASLDRVWGIGFTAREAMAGQNRERWGESKLDKAFLLMNGREGFGR